MWEHWDAALYRCGNIEMQLYTDVGTQRCGAIHGDVGLWEHRAVGLYSCGTLSLSLSIYIYQLRVVSPQAVSTKTFGRPLTASVNRHTDRHTHTDTQRDDRRAEMRAKWPFRDVTNSGRDKREGAGKRCLEREQHLVPVPTLTPTSSAGPTKLIVTPHLQFTQLQLVEVFLETLRSVVNKGVWCLFQPR